LRIEKLVSGDLVDPDGWCGIGIWWDIFSKI